MAPLPPVVRHTEVILPRREAPGYRAGMAENAIKVMESTEVCGVFHCEHKPVVNGSAEKGQALLCEACSAQLASGARLAGEGYVLRQTAFGGWVKSKAAAK
jgi:hypothetical protein